MTWPLAHEENQCTFWTSCTGLSWKHPFLFIMGNFCYSWFTEMRILVGRVLHTATDITLKMRYLLCFFFSFWKGWWTKGETIVQEESLSTCFMEFTVHQTALCTFWTSQTFVSGNHCFLCIMHEFVHSSITYQATLDSGPVYTKL